MFKNDRKITLINGMPKQLSLNGPFNGQQQQMLSLLASQLAS